MDNREQQHFFQCPYCWEQISMFLVSLKASQTYIEDCEVCCNPINIVYSFDENGLTSFQAKNLDD